ncbi:hypothetical protein EV715DRAFT_275033 [Schizophyllum commune]
MPPGKPPEKGDAGGDSDGRTLARPRRNRDPLRHTTPPYVRGARPKTMKKKLDAIIGRKSCMFGGLQDPNHIEFAHWLCRELESQEPDMFNRIENAIGSLVKLSDGSFVRELHLDSPGNQESMTSSMHSLFDGRNGVGSGSFCLVPIPLLPRLDRIRDNPHMDPRELFPEDTSLFYLHAFRGSKPIRFNHQGPPLRSYDHLPSAVHDRNDPALIDAICRHPNHTDHADSPDDAVSYYTIDPDKPDSEGLYVLRSHLEIVNVLAETATKLYYHWKTKGLKGADKTLFDTMWPIIGHWVDPDAKAPTPTSKPARHVANSRLSVRRRSERIKNASTIAAHSKPMTSARKRGAQGSAPTVLATSGSATVTRKRSIGKISGETAAKPPQKRARTTSIVKGKAPATTAKSSARVAPAPTAAKTASRRAVDVSDTVARPSKQRKFKTD